MVGSILQLFCKSSNILILLSINHQSKYLVTRFCVILLNDFQPDKLKEIAYWLSGANNKPSGFSLYTETV